ncbi:hypothetical protein [Algicola sagamiensis]|uniref:hypothetical protein n=1 Tax=Algicola sagamiensis TaxID=163869 RepID=UPI000372836D|nr:hypothetical protein [Algicola sagamiensis]
MLRLSRQGWNNVLIFSMLIMIFLFNGLHHRMLSFESEPQSQQLLPEESMLLTLELPPYSIERIGKAWRIQPGRKDTSEAELHQLTTAWQSISGVVMVKGELPSELLDRSDPDQVVVAWLAGRTDGYQLYVYRIAQNTYIYDAQTERWLRLMPDDVDSLLLKE